MEENLQFDSYRSMTMFEFYSGIGGMRMAVKEIGLDIGCFIPYEINPGAVAAYRHNFSVERNVSNKKNGKARNLLGLSLEEWERISPDIVTMSPPCQPFTRQGLQKGKDDARCGSLYHILALLKKCTALPSYFLLENVKGFEVSSARNDVTEVLLSRGYHVQEYLLCPSQLGVPNSRLRYYLLACRVGGDYQQQQSSLKVSEEAPLCLCLPWIQKKENSALCLECGKTIYQKASTLLQKKHLKSNCTQLKDGSLRCYSQMTPTLQQYFSNNGSQTDEQLLLTDKVLLKYSELLDVTDSTSKGTCCFTKAYGRLVEGTGSVFNPKTKAILDEIYSAARNESHHKLELLKSLRLRYFSHREALDLMCFPTWFEFPSEFSTRQQYQLIGNSVNVLTVAVLIAVLLEMPSQLSKQRKKYN